jgi:hypothetical protein
MKNILNFLIVFFLVSCNTGGNQPELKWVLPPADFDRVDFPVSIILPDEISPEGKSPELIETTGRQKLVTASQIAINGDNHYTLSWIVAGSTPAGVERSFQLSFVPESTLNPAVEINKNDTTLLVTKEGKPVLEYRHAFLPAPKGQSYLFERSGFIHPLYSPSGDVLTCVQPPDHIHHVGLWNPWTKVSWKGNNTDFWNLGAGQGTVRFSDFLYIENGPVFAEFSVLQDHIAFLPPKPEDESAEYEGEDVTVMEEEWIVRVWDVDDGYMIDFTSLIRNIMDVPISLDAYRYGGGIGYRATSEWTRANSSVMTSEGRTRKDADATRARWCWVSGDLRGTYTGLLFMSDTTNYDYPQLMRVWPENSNGVGHQFFEFTPIREKAWILEPEKTYSQKYRIWIREGDLNAGEADLQWLQYVNSTHQKISYLSK